MSFGRFHKKLASVARQFCLEALAPGDVSELVTQVLERSSRLRQRHSPLQPRLIFWLVIGMAFWRHDSIPAVLGRLLAGLRPRMGDIGLRPVTESALAHARRRLGVRPLRLFFRELGARVRPPASFCGLRV